VIKCPCFIFDFCEAASSVLTTLNSVYRFGYYALYLRIPIGEVPFDNAKEASKFAKVSVRPQALSRSQDGQTRAST
jgi:hypothetical protein